MKRIILFAALALGACQTTPAPDPAVTVPPPIATTAAPAPVAPLEAQGLVTVEDLLKQVIPDAIFAQNLAMSNNDQYAPQCEAAIAAVAQAQLAKLQALPTTLPQPHLITSFQIGRDLVKLNPLNGGLPPALVNGCGGLAQDVKLDVLNLLMKLVGQSAVSALTGIIVP